MSLPLPAQSIYVDSLGNPVITNSVPIGFAAGFMTRYHFPLDTGEAVLQFQYGDPKKHQKNGLTNEVLIATVIHHLTEQNRIVGNYHNVKALEHLHSALAHLDARTLGQTIGCGFKTTS